KDSRDQIGLLEERVGTLAAEIAEKNEALETARLEAQDSVERAERDMVSIQKELETAQASIESISAKAEQSDQRIVELERERDEAQKNIQRLEKEVAAAERKMREEEEKHVEAMAGIGKEMEAMRSRLMVLSESNTKLEQRLQEAFSIVAQKEEPSEPPPRPAPSRLPAEGTPGAKEQEEQQDEQQDERIETMRVQLKAMTQTMQTCLIELEQGRGQLESGQGNMRESKEKCDLLFKTWTQMEQRIHELPPHIQKEAHFRYIGEIIDNLREPMRATHAAFNSAERISKDQYTLIEKLRKILMSEGG
ncbi:MAG: hypothetical protein GXP54_01440, partial [Deltaproteobacteria bacterium]|nr:hypothetical protein [Deltaproteobacteria bacterium]